MNGMPNTVNPTYESSKPPYSPFRTQLPNKTARKTRGGLLKARPGLPSSLPELILPAREMCSMDGFARGHYLPHVLPYLPVCSDNVAETEAL